MEAPLYCIYPVDRTVIIRIIAPLSQCYNRVVSVIPALQSILNNTIRGLNGKRVISLHVALGELSEADPISIQTQWRELSKGTRAEHAQLHFRLIPAEVQCMACFQKYHPVDRKILCPYCGSFGAKILTGEECYLESIETEHD